MPGTHQTNSWLLQDTQLGGNTHSRTAAATAALRLISFPAIRRSRTTAMSVRAMSNTRNTVTSRPKSRRKGASSQVTRAPP